MPGAVYEITDKVEEDVLCESCLAEKYNIDMKNYKEYLKKISAKPCEICGHPNETDQK